MQNHSVVHMVQRTACSGFSSYITSDVSSTPYPCLTFLNFNITEDTLRALLSVRRVAINAWGSWLEAFSWATSQLPHSWSQSPPMWSLGNWGEDFLPFLSTSPILILGLNPEQWAWWLYEFRNIWHSSPCSSGYYLCDTELELVSRDRCFTFIHLLWLNVSSSCEGRDNSQTLIKLFFVFCITVLVIREMQIFWHNKLIMGLLIRYKCMCLFLANMERVKSGKFINRVVQRQEKRISLGAQVH